MARDVILWILADELRADALSCVGPADPAIRTPHIDALAARGVVFDEAYAASPVCVPSRVSMLTGLRPDESGVWGNEATRAGVPVRGDLVTFPEVLARQGWQTCSFGKAHVPPALRPWQVDDPTGSNMRELRDGAEEHTVVTTPELGMVVAGRWPDAKPYPSDAVTGSAVEAIRSTKGPLLVRASYLQPHTPVVVPEPWFSRYANVRFEPGGRQGPADSAFERWFADVMRGSAMPAEARRQALAAYHGAVAWLDDQVGILMDALDETPGLGRVTVVLTADHGAHLGDNGAYGKHTFARASHRIPLIVAGGAVGEPGSRRSDLASNADLARTVLSAAGVEAPDGIGGRDLANDAPPPELVSGIGYGEATSRALPNLGAGTGGDGRGWPQRVCVRTPRYRLDLTTRVDGRPATPLERDVFLVDRETDRDERRNVAGQSAYATVERRLAGIALAAASGSPPGGHVLREH